MIVGSYETTLDGGAPDGDLLPAGGDSGDGSGAAGNSDAADSTDAGDLLWSAHHEQANFDEWVGDGTGIHHTRNAGKLELTSDYAHTGQTALVASISPRDNLLSHAVVGRGVKLPSARYGAWYLLPDAPTTGILVIMKLSAENADRFDIDIVNGDDSAAYLRLYEHAVGWISDPSPIALPIGEWVHIEVFLRTGNTGELVVFQNGRAVLESGTRTTITTEHLSWMVGAVSGWVVPQPFRVLIDDATIRSAAAP